MTESAEAEIDLAELRRLHFLTPWVNSGRLLLLALGGSFAIFRDDPGQIADAWSYIADQPLGVVVAIGVAAVVFGVGGVVAWSFFAWRMTGYAVSGATLYVRRGVVVKQRRKVRLDRLQGIDVFQPLLGRVFGLASLKLEMAAGADATTSLGLLTLAEAHDLRAELLSHTRQGDDGEAPEHLLLAVPTSRVLGSQLLAAGLPLLVLVMYLIVVSVVMVLAGGDAARWLAIVLVVVPVVALVGRRHARAFMREADFKLTESADGLRIHSGLVSLNHRTIPPRRIQGLHIEVPFLWRFLGWARLTVDVAGSVASSSSDRENFQPAVNTLVPVASTAEVLALFNRLAGVDLSDVPLSPVPRVARMLDPWAGRWEAVGVTDTVAVTRTGSFERRTAVVPFARIQSVRATQGFVQRWLGLATLHLDGPVGSTAWRAPHQDVADARKLLKVLSEKATSARLAET